jgi:16S rRNA pseudouridine516 synthase
MRLDRFLSHGTRLSRSQATRAVRTGEVRVNGAVVNDPGAHVRPEDRVEHRGQRVEETKPRYFMLNKPAGYVCATDDAEHPTVLALLEVSHPERLHIAGRLDIDATGLVLITDDGEWSHRITSPRHVVPKTYRVTLAESLGDDAAAELREGVWLRGEKQRCEPAGVERVTDREVRLTITEGRYHQVKRMLAAVGNHVVALHRERIGTVALDPALPAGAARPLTAEEIASLGT